MTGFLLALSFLTRIPVRPVKDINDRRLASCSIYFPVVGLVIGIILAAGDNLASRLFPPLVVAALDLLILFAETGGLHIDGFIDTADGLMSGKPRERMLEIMKDSRTGALGVTAVIILLILKFALFTALPADHRFASLILFPSLGRWAMVLGIAFYPYARKGGLGKPFGDYVGKREFLLATLFAFAFSFTLVQERGLLAFLAAGIAAVLASRVFTHVLGGLTGDTYGAINELVEVVVLMVLAAGR
ncbi:MAG: adenosylcobinamide-GDP ribazoletransferase [Thermosediminibacterales bacterium]|nr:adenosylcobinamide-GDP ribazoletransferase [Thermosediminibacterales bacterium]MDK2835787.1 adenosylcobinamide-GDP ribazoletransferase [Thermosediminibacterales bacterium]